MPSQLCVSIRLLQQTFHGRDDRGASEWPPSPLRLFQSLVAAAARRSYGDSMEESAKSALVWLEGRQPPVIIAPDSSAGEPYTLSVPNNAMDIVAAAWSRGNESNSGDANPATHRTMKTLRPRYLTGGDTVHYLWTLDESVDDETRTKIDVVTGIARDVVALGLGIDLAVGHAAVISSDEADALPGERWTPAGEDGARGLRVPVTGSLADMLDRHRRFLSRLEGGRFTPPPSLAAQRPMRYRRPWEPPKRPMAAFSLLTLDASHFRPFDTTRRALTVAGMVRHATKRAAVNAGWPEPKVNAVVLGHGDASTGGDHVPVGPRRFAYVPLPSLERRGKDSPPMTGSIRRVIVMSFAEEAEAEIAWARRALAGEELVREDTGESVAMLSLLPASDGVVQGYTRPSASWATVTPIVLPGFDDPAHYRRRLARGVSPEEQRQLLATLDERVDGLLRKAILHAGFSPLLARHAEIDWSPTGFWAGADLAERYGVPDHLKRFPRLHVKVRWRDDKGRSVPISGPVCLGAGRFYGLGLFAADAGQR